MLEISMKMLMIILVKIQYNNSNENNLRDTNFENIMVIYNIFKIVFQKLSALGPFFGCLSKRNMIFLFTFCRKKGLFIPNEMD